MTKLISVPLDSTATSDHFIAHLGAISEVVPGEVKIPDPALRGFIFNDDTVVIPKYLTVHHDIMPAILAGLIGQVRLPSRPSRTPTRQWATQLLVMA